MTHIVHIVLLEWSPGTPHDVKVSAREMILGFSPKIDGIVSVVEGASVSPERLEDGLDYGFVITFIDAAARDAYLPHPVHVEFAELVWAHSAKVVVYDLESTVPSPGGF